MDVNVWQVFGLPGGKLRPSGCQGVGPLVLAGLLVAAASMFVP